MKKIYEIKKNLSNDELLDILSTEKNRIKELLELLVDNDCPICKKLYEIYGPPENALIVCNECCPVYSRCNAYLGKRIPLITFLDDMESEVNEKISSIMKKKLIENDK
jgi:hypothetical protein